MELPQQTAGQSLPRDMRPEHRQRCQEAHRIQVN
jgi:hypothetical protein